MAEGKRRQFSIEQDESSSGPMFTVFNEHGTRVTDPYINEADANLIVTAVNTYSAVEGLVKALEPFIAVLENDISQDEAACDIFRPMTSGYNRAPILTVGDFRNLASAIGSFRSFQNGGAND